MPFDLPLASLPPAALVFPLVVAVALIASGASTLIADRRHRQEEVGTPLPWIRVTSGLVLLVSSGTAFSVSALVALVLCGAALWSALADYSRYSLPGGARRVAGSAALVASGVVTVASDLIGYDGVAAQLARFELHDLSWAAATVVVLAVSVLLQLGPADRRPPGSPRTPGDDVPTLLDSRATW